MGQRLVCEFGAINVEVGDSYWSRYSDQHYYTNLSRILIFPYPNKSCLPLSGERVQASFWGHWCGPYGFTSKDFRNPFIFLNTFALQDQRRD